MTRLAIAILLVSAQAAVFAQRDVTQKTAVGTATLGGQTVTTDDPARPLRRVLVTLSGAEIRGSRQAISDDSGRFVFETLPAGRYTLTAQKPAYVTTHYGSPRLGFGPGTPVAVADGSTERVTIGVARGAVLAGVIRSVSGVPLANAGVQVYRALTIDGQIRTSSIPGVAGQVAADERGRYRFFGLPPGEYVVRGSGGSGLIGEIRLTTDEELAIAAREIAAAGRPGSPQSPPAAVTAVAQGSFAMTYAPDAPDPQSARRFRLAAGQEVTDADITVSLSRSAAVQGISLGPGGGPLQNVMVSIVNLRTRSLWASPGLIRPGVDGTFRLGGMAPGEYALVGRGAEDASIQTGAVTLYAEAPFTLNGVDVTGLVMQFARGVAVSGRVETVGGVPIPASTRVGLISVSAIPNSARPPVPVEVGPGGNFSIPGVPPGKYRIVTTGMGTLSLRSAVLNDVDTLDVPFDVEPGQDVAGLRLLLTPEPTQLTGTLLDSLGRPAPEFSVVVFSTNRAHWAEAPRRLTGLVKLDSRGTFRITGLPPGTYFLSAVTDAEPAELGDPAFLEQLASAALTIALGEREQKVQDIRIK